MLTPIQIEIAKIINDIEGREFFVLAGGGALILREISNRQTADLDYFTKKRELVNTFTRECVKALIAKSFKVEEQLMNDGFCRLAVTSTAGETIVDFGYDYFSDSEPSELGPTLSLLGLGANKILALSGRSQARDGFDLFSICQSSELKVLIEHAIEIDPGFRIDQLISGLKGLTRFGLEDSGFSREQWELVLDWAKSTIDLLDSSDK